jgi:hypothetical protein
VVVDSLKALDPKRPIREADKFRTGPYFTSCHRSPAWFIFRRHSGHGRAGWRHDTVANDPEAELVNSPAIRI